MSESKPLLGNQVSRAPNSGATGSSSLPSENNNNNSKALQSLSQIKPVCLTFREICYEVIDKSTKQTKQILKDVSGYAKPGEILAIMGPSGSGKTSLLNIIGARTVCTSGYLMKNGRPVTVTVKKSMGFVSQKDYLFATLTVRETIKCYADLRLDESVTEAQKNARVNELLQLLQLEKVADSYIGDEISKGLSGGERKRVSIACQLVHSPNILLLDEPTSGLDASTAYQVVKILRDLASLGHTVICTIHQPRESLFSMFDRLMMLSLGETFYFGAVSDTIKYYAEKGYPCPQYANPADFFIDVLTGTVIDDKKKAVVLSASEFYDSKVGLLEVQNVEKSSVDGLLEFKMAEHVPADDDEVRYVTGFMYQLAVLTNRSFKNEIRNPLSSFVAVSRTIFMSILVGALYYRLKLEEPAAVFNRQGCIFFVLINVAFSTLASIRLFIEEREIFAQEKNSDMYRSAAYFISKCIAELPLLTLLQVVFAAITFWMVGLHDNGYAFVMYFLFIFLLAYASASYTVAIGALAQDEKAAVTITPILLTLFLLFGGNTFISTASIPVWFSWIQWVSFFRYSTGGVLKVVFDGLTFTGPGGSSCNAITCRFPNGKSALESFGLGDEDVLRDVVCLIAISLFFRIVSYTGLRLKFKPVIPKNKAKSGKAGSPNSYGALEP